jgi:hypothetical protein
MPIGEYKSISADAYQHSFGALKSGTLYHSGARGLRGELKSQDEQLYEEDMRPELKSYFDAGLKALTSESGGAGTAGYAMVPIYVDPRVIDRTRKQTPLVELIPRVSNNGITADYNVITAKGGGFVAAEDAALNETNTTYDRASTSIKYLYAVGRVTGQAMAAMPSYVLQGMQPSGGAVGSFGSSTAANAKQIEVLVKTREIRELEEDLIINGDTDSDANEFNGIIDIMSTTNTVDKNTTALELSDINLAVRYAFDDGGMPNLAVCSSDVYNDLLDLLTPKIGYMQPTQKVFWGFTTIVLHTMVGDIPVVPSRFMSNDSGSKAIYFLDMGVVEMRVLQDLTYEELAKTNDSQKFMLKIYEALIIKAPTFCSSITEIA